MWLCCDASYKHGKQPSGSSPSFLCCSTPITPPFLPHLRRSPHGFRVATSFSLCVTPAFRHSHGIMSKIGEPKVRFLSLSSLQTSRSGLLLAESALFTLPSLLFAADEGGIPARHCFFFFLSVRFATALTFFSFFLPSFSHQARVLRARQSLSTDFNASPAPLQQRPRRSTPHRFSTASSSWSSPRFDAKPPLNAGVAARSPSSSYSKQQPRREQHRQRQVVKSSRSRTSANLGVELARTSDAARRTSASFWRLAHIITADGQAVVSSRRNCDIEEQETGVELAPKLPQIVPITTTPGGRLAPRTLYSTALNRPRGTTFLLYAIARAPLAWVAPISAYKFKPPRAR